MTDAEQLSAALAPRFEIDRALAGDPVATRYLAHAEDGTPAIVLAVAPSLRMRMRAPERFAETMRRTAVVKRMGLPPPIEAGITPDGVLYCALSRPEGEPVRARLDRDGALDAATVAVCGAALADALADAHRAGVVHGAISPDCIWVTPTGKGLQLAELGVHAALLATGIEPRALLDGHGAQYASPEQVSGAAASVSSDVYSLGATLYELLTGKPPFGGRTTTTIMASVLADEPVMASQSGEQTPGPVASALLRAIERAPDDRWPNAETFADALRGERQTPASVSATPAPRARRGCAAALLLALAGTGAIAAATLALVRR